MYVLDQVVGIQKDHRYFFLEHPLYRLLSEELSFAKWLDRNIRYDLL